MLAWFAFTSSKTRWTSCRLGGEPSRSPCQDVALELELLVLASQTRQLLTLGGAQDIFASTRLAAVGGGLRDPARDALCGDVELTRELRRRAPGMNQLDHLPAELRRIRRLRCGHFGLLLH
jgi:hypothetical protein